MRCWALLLIAVVAPSLAPPRAVGQEPNELQARVDALAQQIYLRHRDHPPSLVPLRDSVIGSLQRWNDAAPTPANRAAMADWLDRAMRAVMPGGSGRLPEPPVFEAPPEPAAPQAESEPAPRETTAEPEPAGPRFVETPRAGRPQPVEAEPVEPQPRSRFAGPRMSGSTAERRSAAKPVTPPAASEESTARPSRRSKWSRHPAAAPLEWRDPFQDDPSASVNPLRSGEPRRALRPTLPESAGVRVNLTQLAADVRGYNAALRDLQAVVTGLGPSDFDRLAAAADELERLEQKRRFLALYRDGLSEAERRSLPDSPSAELVRELVRRHAEALLQRTPPERRAQRQALKRLTDRLVRLGGESLAGY